MENYLSDPIMSNTFKWQSAVRSYEIDNQGIVNNAVYLNYFDHVRVLHLKTLGIDWSKLHDEGYDLVVAKTEISYKVALKIFDEFYITSSIALAGKITIACEQSLFLSHNKTLAATAKTKIACIEVISGKLRLPGQLKTFLA